VLYSKAQGARARALFGAVKMSVATLRAQFGLLPAGDPYANTYVTIEARNKPLTLAVYSFLNPAAVPIFLNLYHTLVSDAMANRYIPYNAGKGPCPNQSSILPIQSSGSALGVPFAVVSGIGPALGPIGAGISGALSVISSLICTGASAAQANFDAVLCQVSATLSQLLTVLDNAVGQGKITSDQANSVWQQYAGQLQQGLANAVAKCNTLTPQTSIVIRAIIGAVGDFSVNFLWPDLYPKSVVVAPASPVISTPTPSPANQFAATPAAPPASTVPSIINPPNSLPGSPTLVSQRFALSSAALPQGVTPQFISGNSLIVPALIIGGAILAAVFL
jgi:hypothetical protein